MEIKSVNYKVLLFRWITGLFILLNIFAFSGAGSNISSVNLRPNTTELKVVNQVVTVSKIFYKSFVDKLNSISPELISLKNAFKNLLVLKDSIVHVQITTNSMLVLFINCLIGFLATTRFLFNPIAQNEPSGLV